MKANLHKLVILKEQKGAKIQIYHEGILRLDFFVMFFYCIVCELIINFR